MIFKEKTYRKEANDIFEKPLEELTASVWIDTREKDVLDKNGHFELNAGFNPLTYHQAVDLIDHYYKIRPSVSKNEVKRFDGVFRAIMYAFGPEFLELHEKKKEAH